MQFEKNRRIFYIDLICESLGVSGLPSLSCADKCDLFLWCDIIIVLTRSIKATLVQVDIGGAIEVCYENIVTGIH